MLKVLHRTIDANKETLLLKVYLRLKDFINHKQLSKV